MQIRYKIAIQFTIIVAIILLIFSAIVYLRAENQQQKNFYDRLQARSNTTARLLVDVQEFTPRLLKLIDRNSSLRLADEEVFVFNFKNELLYSNVEHQANYISNSLLEKIRQEGKVTFNSDERQVVGVLFAGKFDRFVVVASATDKIGISQKENLIKTLTIGLLSGILITIVLGIFFASQALKPIQSINEEISRITAHNLKKRLDEGNGKDEIAELSVNFNDMLQRLEMAFIQQKQFVSQASHELRTPLAALKTEVQVGLEEEHSMEEYQQMLRNILNDTERLIQLSNGLLQLAKTIDEGEKFVFEVLRTEEILLNAQKAVQNSHQHYKIIFGFEMIPEEDNLTLINGNEVLLENLFVNLLENACKYSSNQQANILLSFDKKYCIIKIKDKGIGISTSDLPYIFNPFYRARNTSNIKGFGIGLSVAKHIIELHNGIIQVKSKLNLGTEFIVKIPHC
ncbi:MULTISPECIES: HAMP domain-containing sensor histidine kinase [unclassified Arcicella]|uniref:HAMP domain-containing sensor histidine kinase n=1 Tax=unclassified Arcicella TaxID=2644986 RepID=UPI00285E879B|nr:MULTISPECIES: HAMP domain-containing sensor histidine kinase [unclassified Arcicella]MDR6564006.1 signal transduction histidine kinase [Arcicella sp. BE51]MDR6813759.1 signal transduction histidine kinase [Arcicella sp. BE140]MDR6825071.1 signal transduction histidine kinase [Arcicella sp. BE139]